MTGLGCGVGVVGLGRMGAGMARRLLACGVPVTVWNRSAARMAELVSLGAVAAESPLAAARGAEVVVLSVADWTAAHGVLVGPGGVLCAGPLAGVLVSTSTVAPQEVAALAALTPAVLDVGLLGNHRHAVQGRLRLYVGGQVEVVRRVRPLLDLLAQQVLHVGELGAGMRLKVLMNLLMGVQVQVLAEVVALGTRVGLQRRLVLDAVAEGGFASPMIRYKARRVAGGDYSDADFRLRLMAKDLALVVAAARQVGVELPLAESAWRTHDAAVALGYGDEDCAVIARMFDASGGVAR